MIMKKIGGLNKYSEPLKISNISKFSSRVVNTYMCVFIKCLKRVYKTHIILINKTHYLSYKVKPNKCNFYKIFILIPKVHYGGTNKDIKLSELEGASTSSSSNIINTFKDLFEIPQFSEDIIRYIIDIYVNNYIKNNMLFVSNIETPVEDDPLFNLEEHLVEGNLSKYNITFLSHLNRAQSIQIRLLLLNKLKEENVPAEQEDLLKQIINRCSREDTVINIDNKDITIFNKFYDLALKSSFNFDINITFITSTNNNIFARFYVHQEEKDDDDDMFTIPEFRGFSLKKDEDIIIPFPLMNTFRSLDLSNLSSRTNLNSNNKNTHICAFTRLIRESRGTLESITYTIRSHNPIHIFEGYGGRRLKG